MTVIALLGAECTGKSSLTAALGQQLADLRAATISEHLRDWCEAHGRTPRQAEQRDIARTQTARIAAAARRHPLVIADTTALMTALYSRHYFADEALFADALPQQRRVALTFLCCPEGIPWQADCWMRDGDSTRQSTHQELLALLTEQELPFVLLQGSLAARTAQAQALIRELPRSGLKLDAKLDAKDERDDAIIRWRCACCPPNPPLC
ncbi:MAG: AAA family ATPase [Burkholderiales bacterium]